MQVIMRFLILFCFYEFFDFLWAFEFLTSNVYRLIKVRVFFSWNRNYVNKVRSSHYRRKLHHLPCLVPCCFLPRDKDRGARVQDRLRILPQEKTLDSSRNRRRSYNPCEWKWNTLWIYVVFYCWFTFECWSLTGSSLKSWPEGRLALNLWLAKGLSEGRSKVSVALWLIELQLFRIEK